MNSTAIRAAVALAVMPLAAGIVAAVPHAAHASVSPGQPMRPPHIVAHHSLAWKCLHQAQIRIGDRRFICVERAPSDVCHAALDRPAPCFWFTGRKSQVVFDLDGFAATS